MPGKGALAMDSVAHGTWRFGGEVGARLEGNVAHWLLRAPGASPGLLQMFHRRDRHWPYQEPVPWAGEFAGKYLISAVQACRMSDDPRLKPFVQEYVDALVACQAEDGYLGPWREHERLLGHWDLWGHYHCMLGLSMWYDDTGYPPAYDCVTRAADCICDTYAAGDRRPIDAGTPQINLAVLHVMAELYQRTGDERYGALVARIEEDLEEDGDWLRKGAEGVPYYQLPGGGTRWESLHIVQGFRQRYEATGEARYKQALVSLWESIRKCDRHPSGAFSTHEQAFGSVYAKGSIETCCSVAWMALTIDALRLTGDATVADELELSTWNQALASQHPSGSWCTYDTPMDGVRAPSFHQINFQYRPGTPELNCCSVNSPRTLGMLSEWAVMEDDAGLAVNFYGPGEFALTRRNGDRVVITQETGYPVEGVVRLTVSPGQASAFTLKLRIPTWSKQTAVNVNGAPVEENAEPGTYLALGRTWAPGDVVEMTFDVSPRYWTGEGPDRGGRAAIYAGPLLLAFDAFFNEAETADLKPVNMAELKLVPVPVDSERRTGYFPPLGLWETAMEGGQTIVLCDFASAGAHGTDYVGWLPASHVLPPPTELAIPEDGAVGTPGPVLFRWTPTGAEDVAYTFLVAKDAGFQEIVAQQGGLEGHTITVREGLEDPGVYYWKVQSTNAYGSVDSRAGPRSFRVDASAEAPFLAIGEDGLMVASPLDGDGAASFGVCRLQEGLAPAADRHGRAEGAVAFSGPASKLRYALPFFPERDYSFHAWVCPEGLPVSGIQQVFSAWCRGMDDPLRVTLDGDAVFARIEARGGFGTEGAPLQNGAWVHVAAVKEGPKLTLFADGNAVHSAEVPERVYSFSTDVGIGYNPLYSGGEHFVGRIDNFAFYARALSAAEIAALAAGGERLAADS